MPADLTADALLLAQQVQTYFDLCHPASYGYNLAEEILATAARINPTGGQDHWGYTRATEPATGSADRHTIGYSSDDLPDTVTPAPPAPVGREYRTYDLPDPVRAA